MSYWAAEKNNPQANACLEYKIAKLKRTILLGAGIERKLLNPLINRYLLNK